MDLTQQISWQTNIFIVNYLSIYLGHNLKILKTCLNRNIIKKMYYYFLTLNSKEIVTGFDRSDMLKKSYHNCDLPSLQT